MCGRSSLHHEPGKLLESYGLPPRLAGYRPRYNITPSQNQWVILKNDDGRIDVRELRWGLIPSWTSDPSIGTRMINARSESLTEKPSYRDLLSSRRCLILSDGYYEWTKGSAGKTPIHFRLAGGKPFVFAGLWDRWKKGETPVESCTVITTAAGNATRAIHDRTPVILRHDDSQEWLNSPAPGSDLLALLRAYPDHNLEMYEVSRSVNNPANDTEECITPVTSLPAPDDPDSTGRLQYPIFG